MQLSLLKNQGFGYALSPSCAAGQNKQSHALPPLAALGNGLMIQVAIIVAIAIKLADSHLEAVTKNHAALPECPHWIL